jgi:cellulose synthase/poly-beta-1,6-N-acetylglucosamine synthase-like glycosyltransferase
MSIRDEENYIQRSLEAVMAQDYPIDSLEIIVCDGISSDKTHKTIVDYSTLHPQPTIRILENPGKIVPTGMNIALRQAKGEIIIRVDGHTVIAPDYVRQCVDTLQRTNADNVGGKMNALGINPFGIVVAVATSTPFGTGGGRFHYSDKEEWVDTVYMGAWPRRVFEKIGLFDEELVRDQDDEFNYRLRDQGGQILLSPAIHSDYTVRSTPRALWRQYYQYGFWKVRVLQKHPRQMSLRQYVPPAFVLSLLIGILVSFFNPWGMWLLGGVIGTYLLANLATSSWIAVRRGWYFLMFLPPVFGILHLSYGLGFLVGLLKFANRWGDKQGKTPPFVSEHARTS